MRSHFLVFGGIFEAIAAVGRVHALEVQVAASLAGRLTIAFDLATLALVAAVAMSMRAPPSLSIATYQASDMYLLLLDFPPGPCWLSSAFLLLPFALPPGLSS